MPDAMIRIENVTKVYGSGEAATTALAGLTLDVERGAWLAIMGPSGHGKSTLLQIMGGLDQPTSGQVHLDGTELTRLKPAELAHTRARSIGFVFQSFNLLPHLTALENIELALWFGGKGNGKARAMELLESVGLEGKAHLPPGALSGGQQIGRASCRERVY